MVKVYIIGENHSDPAAANVIKQALAKLRELRVPVAFCLEFPTQVRLDDVLSNLEGLASMADEMRTNPMLAMLLLKRDSEHKQLYCPFSIEELYPKMLQLFPPTISKEFLLEQTKTFVRSFGTKEKISLLRLIKAKGIPYHGIDLHAEFDALPGTKGREAAMLAQEQQRMPYMAGMVAEVAAQMPANGIIFVLTGNDHVKGLAAKLLALNVENIKAIIPMHVSSNYSFPRISDPAFVARHAKFDRMYAEVVLAEKPIEQTLYRNLPCPMVSVTEQAAGVFTVPTEISKEYDATAILAGFYRALATNAELRTALTEAFPGQRENIAKYSPQGP